MACLALLPIVRPPAEVSLSKRCHVFPPFELVQSCISWSCASSSCRGFNCGPGELLKKRNSRDHGVQYRLLTARGSFYETAGIVVSIAKSSSADIAVDSECGQTRDYDVRETKIDEELWAAAWIRAESYFEDRDHVRYIESFKKRFAEQEFFALKKRLNGKYGPSVKCICFIAIIEESAQSSNVGGSRALTTLERVVGTLDLSVRQLTPSEKFPGDSIRATLSMDELDHRGFYRYGYISNVCVVNHSRKKGIGSKLLQAAIDVAKDWGLEELFVHVNSNNSAASQLYAKNNFEIKRGIVRIAVANSGEIPPHRSRFLDTAGQADV